MQTWRIAKNVVKNLNQLDRGDVSNKLASSGTVTERQVKVTAARLLAERSILRTAALLAKARRGLSLTGVHYNPVAALLKMPLDEWGYASGDRVKQVPMIADRMVEPSDAQSIDMLAALPPDDAIFYADEQNVVDKNGKSQILFEEIEEHYGFVGGSSDEYLKYLRREDVQHLWSWAPMEEVKAIAGISTVLKKDGFKQRKLIMQCAANYAFQDPSEKAHLGMAGGSALTRCGVPSDCMAVAACDEDSAFTMVRVPEWMAAWQCGPPVQVHEVFSLLPKSLQDRFSPHSIEWIAPKYVRLAMGGSHSVYILMRINLHRIGQTMYHYANFLRDDAIADSNDHSLEVEAGIDVTDDDISCDDAEWNVRQVERRAGQVGASGYTVDGWCEHVRRLKHYSHRTVVIMHFFAGDRREGDIEDWLEKLSKQATFSLEVISVDLAHDPLWDLTCAGTFHKIMQLVEEGLIDLVLGGPPCWTVARSRHVPIKGGGPRPLRFRWCVWGRHDLRPHEQCRLQEACWGSSGEQVQSEPI